MIDEKKLIEGICNHDIEIPDGLTERELNVFLLGLNEKQIVVMDEIKNQPKVGEWIPVSEKLPENEKIVEITFKRTGYVNKEPYYFTTRVFYTDGKTLRDNSAYNWDFDDVDMEYDEEHDDYIVPCGWWEVMEWGNYFSAIDDFVIAWRPLGEPYKDGDTV